MKQRFLLLFSFVLLIGVLVVLNALSYVQKEKPPDSEEAADRSTFNHGATGTSAFYSLLSETGHKVMRWQLKPSDLSDSRERPAVLVMIGQLKREITSAETEDLLRWVSDGGRLILVDRTPPKELITTSANWRMIVDEHLDSSIYSVDPADSAAMTADVPPARPGQPSLLTSHVEHVQPSLFASTVSSEPIVTATPAAVEDKGEPSPAVVAAPSGSAPLNLLASAKGSVLTSAPFGSGEIVVLTDPYILSNGGIALADNAALGIDLVSRNEGLIAFDEYHHGYGANNNRFLEFFAGTPVVPMFFQIAFLLVAVFYSQSRRFARPLPPVGTDRLSKLEYISAMAELQQRARAYDLAIENIYNDFHLRASRLLGLDPSLTTSEELGRAVAERTGLRRNEVTQVCFACREIIRGEPTNQSETVALVSRLRDFEQKLGIGRVRSSTA